MKFIVVENRINNSIESCYKSLRGQGLDFKVINSVDAGEDYERFKASYVHKSPNSNEFELICFRRYFLIKNALLSDVEIKEFVLLDSDVVVFQGVNNFFNSFSGEYFRGSFIRSEFKDRYQISPHASFWSRDAIFDFVNFLLNYYLINDNLILADEICSKLRKKNIFGGISDMTLLFIWANSNNSLRSTSEIINNACIDHNINIPHNYHDDEYYSFLGFKKVVYSENNTFLINRATKYRVVVVLLHFQGRAKLLMKYASNDSRMRFLFLSYLFSSIKYINNLIRKFN